MPLSPTATTRGSCAFDNKTSVIFQSTAATLEPKPRNHTLKAQLTDSLRGKLQYMGKNVTQNRFLRHSIDPDLAGRCGAGGRVERSLNRFIPAYPEPGTGAEGEVCPSGVSEGIAYSQVKKSDSVFAL